MDPGFLNDSTIYYNLPPLSKVEDTPRRSTLPRPHSTCFFDRSYSCPASPKLSLFNPNIKVENEPNSKLSLKDGKPLPPLKSSCLLYKNDIKDTNLESPKLKVEEICYSEVAYQNVETETRATKLRKKYLFSWWKKRKNCPGESENIKCSTEINKENGKNLENSPNNLLKELNNSLPKCSTEPERENGKNLDNSPNNLKELNNYIFKCSTEHNRENGKDLETSNKLKQFNHSLPEDSCPLRQYSSSCSSSTTTLNDFENETYPSGESVVGGVTYVRPTKTPKQGQDCKDEKPDLNDSSSPRQNPELSGRIGYWVREWRRKSRWLSKRRREKNPRHSGEGDLDIAIIHCDSDTSIWADYWCNNFSNLFEDKLGRSEIRVEKIRIEAFSGYQGIPEVQASRIKNAKLQMIILSPNFLSFLNSEVELLLGKFLRPSRVLALLLGVTKETIKADKLALSSLYSFDEWPCLEVRDRDEKFVNLVQEESLKLLNRCDLFDEYKISSAFNICPRKITQSYCKVYIHLRSPLIESQRKQVQVTVEKQPSISCPIQAVHHHNPFTLSFDVPEKLLGVSSFLKVNLFIENKLIGSREVKCEGPMEVLRDILNTAVDPITLICQALHISPASDDLDEYLTQKLKAKLPTHKWMNDKSSNNHLGSDKDLPTWLHFSAFYGLQNFTWALLELQNFERALVIKNSKGQTPAKLALQAGYTKLAQDLENLAMVMSLAQTYNGVDREVEDSPRVSRSDICSAPLQSPRSSLFSKRRKEMTLYDTPPHPRPLSEISLKRSQPVCENLTSTPKEGITLYANLIGSPSLSNSEGEEYLDMSGSYSTLENYKNDICNLMTAWDTRHDVQTFLNEYEPTISKLKENLNLHSSNQNAVSLPIKEEENKEQLKDD